MNIFNYENLSPSDRRQYDASMAFESWKEDQDIAKFEREEAEAKARCESLPKGHTCDFCREREPDTDLF